MYLNKIFNNYSKQKNNVMIDKLELKGNKILILVFEF